MNGKLQIKYLSEFWTRLLRRVQRGLGQEEGVGAAALDGRRVLDGLEQLERVIVHDERLRGAGDGVVVLEQTETASRLDQTLEIAFQQLHRAIGAVLARSAQRHGVQDFGRTQTGLKVSVQLLQIRSGGEVARPVGGTALAEDVAVHEEVAAQRVETLAKFLHALFHSLFERLEMGFLDGFNSFSIFSNLVFVIHFKLE